MAVKKITSELKEAKLMNSEEVDELKLLQKLKRNKEFVEENMIKKPEFSA